MANVICAVALVLMSASACAGALDVARGEYAKYCRMITGGDGPKAAFAVDPSLDASHDEYRIVTEGGGVRFAGASERAVLYAVYDFLERRGGCAWFWDGDRVPKRTSIDCAGLDVREKARFEYRGLRYFAHRSLTRFQAEQWDLDDWKREIDWCCKRRLNLMMPRIGQDDLFSRAFPDVVPYPKGYEGPSATPRSYDDRTLFWDMKLRSEIRRGIVDYARERGMDVPVDTGTMSHWYSRTPQAFLDKMKPDFIPQASAGYRQKSGLVWDIRQDKWLDAYWKLTQAEIDTYFGGKPRLFHTIGLGERVCYKDRAQNHAFKLYANRRIIDKLREHYARAPLLIGSWDFISTWSPGEVRSFVETLDPANTLILDYTSDIWDNDDNFQNWDILGKFPWIYGIFHAYEASSEIRGNYANIRQRFPKAAADPMCKGVIFWPEQSHGDPLMIDYFPSIGWDPSVYEIDGYLSGFCRRRYGAGQAERRLGLWRRFLPLAEASRWGTQVGNGYRYNPVREFYPDVYFAFRGWFYGDDPKYAAQHAEYYVFEEHTLGPLVTNAVDTLDALAGEDFARLDAMTRRDLVDIARTTLARMIELQMARIGRRWNEYVFGGEADAVRRELAKTRALGHALTKVLESSGEFSLNAALADLRRHPSNPDFEKTLKGNAENSYCRSFVYELSKEVYEPAFAAFADWAEERLARDDRSRLNGTGGEQDRLFDAVREAFYAKPLAEMAPNPARALAELPEVLRAAAAEIADRGVPASAGATPSFWTRGRFAAVTSPDETCVAVGEPFSFQVTYRCRRPWKLGMVGYAGKPLPDGFAFDPKTGVLTGRMDAAGERMVTFVIYDETGRTVTWGDLKVKATPSRRQPKTLAGETFYQLQMPGFTESGDFAGVRSHLKRIADLGVSWVYLSPITVADRGEDRTYWSDRQRRHGNPRNPYRPADYRNVDPDYGTNESFRELVDEAHGLGLKVMTDVVFFHCGPNAVFLKEHPDWICRDKDGKPVANAWKFPKLNIADRELRKYLKDSLAMWAVDYGVDGFRVDCGCDTPLDFWEDCAAAIDAKKKDFVWLLEGTDPKYGEKAFNVFYGFICGHGGVNAAMDELFPASVIREKWQEERRRGPAHAFYMRGTDTHDVANDDGERRQERRWGHARAETALALSFALDGPVMLWQGQEIGWDRPYCIFTHTCPDWSRPPVPERAAVVRRLATLKRTEPAFGPEGRLVWLEPDKPDDQVLFLRVAPDGVAYRCSFDLRAGTWDISKACGKEQRK